MPATAATPGCVPRSPRSTCVISPASSRMPRPGRPGWRRCRRNPGRAAAGQPAGLAVIASTSRCRTRRSRSAHRDAALAERRGEEWLLIEWPPGEREPTKYWFANLPDDISFERLVDLTKLRRIERDYQELKQE